ncbi:protein IMPACT-like [Agrilus planipennis]|uniref:Protein IMPACT-like n=1 Tax=Agrilus planipennis TaxID=224129 RepID=A0A1W4XAE6_AGRPL|nr:protein IMPACT-like [Agrilus planipennis]
MDLNSNISLQKDEIEALSAIYGSQWEADQGIEDSFTFHVDSEVQVYITLNKSYPSESPPAYQLLAPALDSKVKREIDDEFKRIFNENCGTPIIFQWLEKLLEVVQTTKKADEIKIPKEIQTKKEVVVEDENLVKFDVTHGSVIEDRKSVFQGHACSVYSEIEVNKFINFLKQNKKIAQATHNISAYRVKRDDIWYQDYDDDGETHAGQRLLHLLQIVDVTNVVVVVTRWYGGVHLGPKRFQHINNAARQVLQQANFIK